MSRFANKDPKAVDSLHHIEELDGDLTTPSGSLVALCGSDHSQVCTHVNVYCKGP